MIVFACIRRAALFPLFALPALFLACNKQDQLGKETGNAVYGKVTVRDGQPFQLSGAVVAIYSVPSDKGPPQMLGAGPINPDTGEYEVRNLPPGECLVTIDIDVNRAPGSLPVFGPNGLPMMKDGGPGGPPTGPPGDAGPKGGEGLMLPFGPPKGPDGLAGKKDDPNQVIHMMVPALKNFTLEKTKLVVKVASGRQELNIKLDE